MLILNGKADAANQKVAGLLKEIRTARFAECEGDHLSTPFQPTFHRAVVQFFQEQWRLRTRVERRHGARCTIAMAFTRACSTVSPQCR